MRSPQAGLEQSGVRAFVRGKGEDRRAGWPAYVAQSSFRLLEHVQAVGEANDRDLHRVGMERWRSRALCCPKRRLVQLLYGCARQGLLGLVAYSPHA